MANTQKIQLLLIDPQNDFCDFPEPAIQPSGHAMPSPALPVPGACADMARIAALIDRLGPQIDDIHVSLDSHQIVDVAHPAWWVNDDGMAPSPFTLISHDDVKSGVWRTRNPLHQDRSLAYVEQLAASGRYPLFIYPEHCVIGTWGHNIHANVAVALNAWARDRLCSVNYVFKGTNPYTEHYSAAQAEVPDPDDPGTWLNTSLTETLAQADCILIAGEALSHCVANTVRDIANSFGEHNIAKMCLLSDCSSSVAGFEHEGKKFIEEMTARGMQLADSTALFS